MNAAPLAADLARWAQETLTGYDPDLGLRDSASATTTPLAYREAVIAICIVALDRAERLERRLQRIREEQTP